ncbi:MAG: TVP38/TMEM64 family protein [Kiloniellaceae bacterium]
MTETRQNNAFRRSVLRRLLPVLALVAAFILARQLGLYEHFSIDTLREHRSALNGFVADMGVIAALAFVALYAVTTLLILPVGAILTIAGGFLFGVTLGTLYVVVGATLGAATLFLVARSAFGDYFRAKAGPFMQRMEAGFRENALSYMLMLRLIPLFPFFVVNVVPAFLGVSLRTYIVGTVVGIVPGTLVFVLAGAGLGSVFDQGGAFTLDSVLTVEVVAGLVGLSLLSLLPVVYKRLKARRAAA